MTGPVNNAGRGECDRSGWQCPGHSGQERADWYTGIIQQPRYTYPGAGKTILIPVDIKTFIRP